MKIFMLEEAAVVFFPAFAAMLFLCLLFINLRYRLESHPEVSEVD